MRRRLIFGGILAALLALASFWWLGRDDGASAEQTDDEVATATLEARRSARREGRVDTSPARLAGLVVDDATGDGVPGAVVSLRLRRLDGGSRGRDGAPPLPLTAVTGADGHFDASALPPGRYSVAVSADGYHPSRTGDVVLAGGGERDDLVFRLIAGGHRLSGRVTDIGGGPVAGAFVQATATDDVSVETFFRAPLSAVTDVDGRYALPLDRGGYSIDVKHADYVASNETIRIDDADRTLDIVLTPGGRVEGVVLRRGDDEPVAGAIVTHMAMGQMGGFTVSGLEIGGSVETDEQGRFSLSGLPGGAVELRAFGRGFASAESTLVELAIAESVTDVVVYVDAAYTVSGFVVDADDAETAVVGALVGAYNLSPGAVYVATEPSADDGYFEIFGVGPGSYTVGLMADERVPKLFGESITVVDRDIDDLVLEVDAGNAIRGRVDPPTAARITLRVADEDIGLGNLVQVVSSFLVNARADDRGEFVVRGVASGHYTLEAAADDGREGSLVVDVADADLDGLVVALEARARVSGVVVDAAGAPVEGVTVDVESPKKAGGGMRFSMSGGGPARGAVTGPDGRFEALGLEDGSYEVSVREGWAGKLDWADRQGDARREPVAVTIAKGADVTGLRLVVESRGDAIAGVVLGPGGAPIADAWVTAQRSPPGQDDDDDDEDDDEDDDRPSHWYPAEKPVLSDADGRFRVERLRPGSYDLEAEGLSGNARGEAKDVPSGGNVTLRLEELASIEGKVSKAGQPVTDYVVVASGPTRRRIHVANGEGTYRLGRLEAGDYELSVTSTAGRADAEVEVATGRTASHDFDLVAYGSVSGRLVDARSGEPLSGFPVFATTGDESEIASVMVDVMKGEGPRTDDDGRFRVSRLGRGKGNIWIIDDEQAGFSLVATTTFDLGAGEDLDVGELRGTPMPKVPKDERGTLGLEVESRPWQASGDDDQPPAGLDPETSYLWVSAVADEGPAAAAGLEPGARITSIDGVEVAAIGADVARRLVDGPNIRTGQTVTLAVDQGGSPTTISIVATAADDE